MQWTLPGPDEFVNTVVDDLQNGGVIVVRLPAILDADDLWAEVVKRLPYTIIDHVDVARAASEWIPGDVVARESGLDGAGWTAARVAACDELKGHVLCIVGMERLGESIGEWSAWITEFASASAAGDELDRPPAALIVMMGAPPGPLPTPGPLIRVHWWWNVLDRLDVAVHVKQLAPDLDAVDREQVIEMAGADIELVERLVEEKCRDEEEIAACCIDRAYELDIDCVPSDHRWRRDSPGSFETDWARGAVDVFDGRIHWHPGVLAVNGNGGLQRRLWTAQVRSLLPAVDLLRFDLIELVRRHQLLPAHLLAPDLEIAELARSLRRVRQEHQLSELADWLRRCRNDLAHLRVVPSSVRDDGHALATRAGLMHE